MPVEGQEQGGAAVPRSAMKLVICGLFLVVLSQLSTVALVAADRGVDGYGVELCSWDILERTCGEFERDGGEVCCRVFAAANEAGCFCLEDWSTVSKKWDLFGRDVCKLDVFRLGSARCSVQQSTG
jgi:hypothetical protein